MNRSFHWSGFIRDSMPHVCGDEPDVFSYGTNSVGVCPTYVGMNRRCPKHWKSRYCMPHVCGDEPEADTTGITTTRYAPRMWG